MKLVLKRICIIALSIMVICTMLPLFTQEANAAVKSPKKKIVKTVKKNITVSTNAKLKKALRQKPKTITIKTSKKRKFNINKGNYRKTKLIVNAKKASVVNKGKFKNITIKAISMHTWREMAKGNVLYIRADSGHIVIPKEANIDSIVVMKKDANIDIEIEGDVQKITLSESSTLRIKTNGTVGSLEVNKPSKVYIEGKSESSVPVSVNSDATGTSINASAKVEVTTKADTEINLSKGAESSKIINNGENSLAEITNNTSSDVKVVTKDNQDKTVGSGHNATIKSSGEQTGTTDENKGGDSSSGQAGGNTGGSTGPAVPSGDITRTVTSFESISVIEAGTIGESLLSVDEVLAKMPKTITGKTSDGNVTFPVLSWDNTDEYSDKLEGAGYYTFTAKLGDPNKTCKVKDGLSAYVQVYVKPVSGGIIYEDSDSGFNKFEVTDYKVIGKQLAVSLKYTGEKYARTNVTINYYDEAGDKIKEGREHGYQEKNSVKTYLFSLPTDSSGEVKTYQKFTLNIDAWGVNLTPVDLEVGVPSAPVKAEDEGEWTWASTVEVRNPKKMELENGQALAFFWEGDKIVGATTVYLGGLTGGETTKRNIWWHDSTKNAAPDKVTVEIQYADVNSGSNTVGENASITYEDSDSGFNKFEVTDYKVIGKQLAVSLKYTGEKYARTNVTINYYDEAGDKIKDDREQGYQEKNSVKTYLFSLPTDSSGEVKTYQKFTLNIDAWGVNLTPVDLEVGVPSAPVKAEDEGEWTWASTVEVRNPKKMELENGQALAFFWEGDKIVGVTTVYLGGLTGGETTKRNIWWHDSTKNAAPDKVTVEIQYADVNSGSNTVGENASITYEDSDSGFNKFEVTDYKVIGKQLAVSLKYTGEKYARTNVTINYYDEAGDKIKEGREHGYQEKNSVKTYLFSLPTDSSGEVKTYQKFTLNIDAWGVNLTPVDLEVGVPSAPVKAEDEGEWTWASTVEVRNPKKMELENGQALAFFWEGDKIVGVTTVYLGGLTGGETTKRNIWWHDSTKNAAPDGVTIEIQYANVSD